MEIAPGIVVDKDIRFGKPVIKGTRVPVELVLSELASGTSFDELMDEYGLNREDILVALGYAASIVASEEVRATG